MRSRPDTCAPTTQKLCSRTKPVIDRFWSAFPLGVGANQRISPARPCSSRRQPAMILTVKSWWLTAAGWGDEDALRLCKESMKEIWIYVISQVGKGGLPARVEWLDWIKKRNERG